MVTKHVKKGPPKSCFLDNFYENYREHNNKGKYRNIEISWSKISKISILKSGPRFRDFEISGEVYKGANSE